MLDTGGPVRLTASGAVTGARGTLLGFYVSSTTGGTIVLYDNSAGSGTQLSGTITPAIGWHFFPVRCNAGIYATIANTLDVTFIVVR